MFKFLEYILNVYTLYALSHLIFATVPYGISYYYSQFTNEEAEA